MGGWEAGGVLLASFPARVEAFLHHELPSVIMEQLMRAFLVLSKHLVAVERVVLTRSGI